MNTSDAELRPPAGVQGRSAFGAAAALVVSLACIGCSSQPGPAPSTPPPGTSAPASVSAPATNPAPVAPSAADLEAMQRDVIDIITEVAGVGSGNGPAADDPARLDVDVYGGADELEPAIVAELERRVRERAAQLGMAVAFAYGAEVSPASP
jgi:hypothetical protein